jgi:putative membrane protein
MTSLLAFLHHVAAFGLVSALVVELVLIRGELTPAVARKLARTDMVLGISATLLLVVGLVRVFWFEKGAAYYFQNAAFLAKLGLFIAVALLSIYPTIRFIKGVDAASAPRIRRILHLELAGVVLILLFAALMADGIGFFG